MHVADSVEVRAATAADEEQIVALQCDRNGPSCDAPVRELLRRAGVGPERFAVAVEEGSGRIVSSLCLIPEHLRIGEVSFTAGQIEYVATAREHERRGLVRSLMDVAHRWSRADGHLAEVIAGIPFFYRRFGYEYAVPFPRVWLLDPPDAMPSGLSVRPAVVGDAEAISGLQREALEGVPLACVGGDLGWWRRRLSSGVEPAWHVAVGADGAVAGAATIGHGPPGVEGVALLGAPALRHPETLAAFAVAAAATGRRPAIQQRPHTDALVRGRGATLHPRQYSLYVRVDDPVALLDRLRPAMSTRLRASSFAEARGELLVTSYERSVLLRYEGGEVVAVSAGPGVQEPGPDGIGIPPDLMATLLFGKHGVTGLAERHEDVVLGRNAELAAVLFPDLERDITLL